MTSHLSERLLSKTLQITNVGEDAEKRESSCTIGGNATWSRHDGKQCSWFPKETKNRTIIRSSNSTPGYISGKKPKILIWKDTGTPMFTTALFTITRTWKQLKSSSTAKWIKMLYACMRAKSLQSCPPLCNPMDHSLPDSSVHGILQARILEWAAMP